jgi:hypothetical protein
MTKSLLDIWLDLTIGEVPPERAHQLMGFNAVRELGTSGDASGGSLQDILDFRPAQDVLLDQGVQEGKDNCATDNGEAIRGCGCIGDLHG